MPYTIRCPFCHAVLHTEFFDDIEAHIMTCRDLAMPEKRGDLAAFHNPGMAPLSCEGESARKAVECS